MRASSILLLSSLFLAINAQQAADGLIVPFTSVLPSCASQCGKLFDVQGFCTPPNIAQISQSCFCSDARLTPFLNEGTSGVAEVCTTASCTAPADLQKIQDWYKSYCNSQTVAPSTTTSSGSKPTGTGSQNGGSVTQTPKPVKHQTWFEGHWRWVVMVIVVTLGIIVVWVGAFMLRKRYLRKKEREIEMKPPVAWGPHQMQNQTGGYTYGDGVVDGSGRKSKEARAAGTMPADSRGGKRENKGWLKKNRT